MRNLPARTSTLALLAVLAPLAALFVYVALRSGPLAPVPIILSPVENQPLSPALFGIGSVEAQYNFKVGPNTTGRLERLDVDVGDRVAAGELLGHMDPVDLDDRIEAQDAALNRATAMLAEAEARLTYAQTQSDRYEKLYEARSASEELAATKRQEKRVAESIVNAAGEEVARVSAERAALVAQRSNFTLVAPTDGLVVARHAEPGTTVPAGQPVLEIVDPASLWVNARFDQVNAAGLASDLTAEITLRSRAGRSQPGRVIRMEPLADPVTEETLAKIGFDALADPLPPIGELAEVTVSLPHLPEGPTIPNAAVRRLNGQAGVWQVRDGELMFTPVRLGSADLNGLVQVVAGLQPGDQVVVYSQKELHSRSRITVVDRLPGVPP